MGKIKVIGVDVDEVIADLYTVWLDMYNKDFKDNKKREDLRSWAIIDLGLKCSEDKIMSYLENPILYENLKPIDGAIQGINRLRSFGYRVVFVSSCADGSEPLKYIWLKENNFLQNKEDWFPVKDKSMVNVDLLIDDKPENIINFPRIGVIYTQPYNVGLNIGKARLNNWSEVKKIPELLEENILAVANTVVHGSRQNDYGSPLKNHTLTGQLFRTYLSPKLRDGAEITAEDVSMLNILQKVSRGIHSITRDTLVDIAGYAANIEMIKRDRREW